MKHVMCLVLLLVVPVIYADESVPTTGKPLRLIKHATAPPLSPEAVVTDWARFLGPNGDMTSPEQPLNLKFGVEGPPLLWEIETGSGYGAPAITGDKLVLFHRIDNQARIDCLMAETGKSVWTFAYPTDYKDRYDFSNGPRASPVISDGKVYAHGAEGKLHCLDLASGKKRWAVDTARQYNVPQDFFGVGPTPLIVGELLIIGLGAPGGPCVIALDKNTGKEVWRAGKKWRAGYASPTVAEFHGKQRVLFFAGGDDDPPTGGLIGIDPSDGRVAFEFPFRSRTYTSVNASNPVVEGNRIFLSSSYQTGGVLLDVQAHDSLREVWRTRKFGAHFMTPIVRDGHLYGVTGSGKGDTELACLDMSTGKTIWQHAPRWPTKILRNNKPQEMTFSLSRGSLLGVKGAFILLGEQGHLAIAQLTPSGYTESSRASLFFANETWTPPVLSHGLLYVCQNQTDKMRNKPPRLLCYSLR